jgi:two-component sensor histidine kinase
VNVKLAIDRALTALHRAITAGSFQAYLFALCCIGVATLARLALGRIAADVAPFLTFYPAILFAALIGGLGPGVFAVVLGGGIVWWAMMPPPFSFSLARDGDLILLAAYGIGSLMIVFAGDYFRLLVKRLEDEENFRKLAVEELSHRLKNKIATLQAIVAIQLREYPQVRDDILGRLNALSATDDLITQTQGQGAYLGDIATAELEPYALSRATMQGPRVLLPPKVALTMALLLHELATNSAKHGSLSAAAGRVAVNWTASGRSLSVEWRESDGPSVTPPTQKGFGLGLLTRALDQFDGAVETNFAASGLVCKMQLVLPPGTDVAAAGAGEPASLAASGA